MNPHQPSQLLTNLGLAALAGFAALAGLFRLSGTITAFLTGHPQPAGGPATGLGVLFTLADPGQAIGAPDLNPFVYWAVLALMLALLGTLAWWVWRLIARAKETKAQDPRLLKGIATPREVEKVASAKTLVSRASTYRPSLEHPTAADVGYVLGRSKGREVWATGLATATNFAAVSGGDFWQGKTASAIQGLLHAAALDGRDAATLYQWALNPTAAADAVRIMQSNPAAAPGWAESLDAMLQADPKTRDSIWQGVSLAFSAFADPRVLAAVTPGPRDQFDPETFIRDRGTLYLLATGAGAGASSALVAAFIEDLVETGRKIAATSPDTRLDPPMLLALDEIGNLAPLPSLPTLMAEGGGTGITTLPVLQSLAQAREKWGENNANAIWDASIVKIILGGASNSRDLQDLSSLIGERDEITDSVTIGEQGHRSAQRSIRRVPIMPPDVIRTLPFGTGVVMLRTARPIVTDLRPWPSRKDAEQLKTDRKNIEKLIRAT